MHLMSQLFWTCNDVFTCLWQWNRMKNTNLRLTELGLKLRKTPIFGSKEIFPNTGPCQHDNYVYPNLLSVARSWNSACYTVFLLSHSPLITVHFLQCVYYWKSSATYMIYPISKKNPQWFQPMTIKYDTVTHLRGVSLFRYSSDCIYKL